MKTLIKITFCLSLSLLILTGCGIGKKAADAITGGSDRIKDNIKEVINEIKVKKEEVGEAVENGWEKAKDKRDELSDSLKRKKLEIVGELEEIVNTLEDHVTHATVSLRETLERDLSEQKLDEHKAELEELEQEVFGLILEGRNNGLEELDLTRIRVIFAKIRESLDKIKEVKGEIQEESPHEENDEIEVEPEQNNEDNEDKETGFDNSKLYKKAYKFAASGLLGMGLSKQDANAFATVIAQLDGGWNLFPVYQRAFTMALTYGLTKDEARQLADKLIGMDAP